MPVLVSVPIVFPSSLVAAVQVVVSAWLPFMCAPTTPCFCVCLSALVVSVWCTPGCSVDLHWWWWVIRWSGWLLFRCGMVGCRSCVIGSAVVFCSLWFVSDGLLLSGMV
jgi:hypothetical protein